MCGRYGLWTDPDQVAEHFQLQDAFSYTARYNIAPSQEILAIGQSLKGERKANMLRWGLVPFWSKDTRIGYKMINARAESIWTKPAYRVAARKQRCLIPASCFFEWRRKDEGNKQPYCIVPKKEKLFAFAGLWEHWEDQESGQKVNSCTIITTKANEAVQGLHDRMPVIILPDSYDLWLDRRVQDKDRLQPLLRPLPSELLNIYPVGFELNRPDNDSEEIIRPISI